MECRKLKTKDFAAVQKLVHQLDQRHAELEPEIFSRPPSPTLTKEQFDRWVTLAHMRALGAFADDILLGFALLIIKEKSGTDFVRERKIATIDPIVVDTNHQKKGVGKFLISEAISRARKVSADHVELVVWEQNEGAKSFYTHLGFRTLHRRMAMKL